MKSRIGTINRKPIVQGDKNLVTPNEIHVSELEGRGQSDIPVEYYKVVAPEGADLDSARREVFRAISSLISFFSCFYVLVKGTSSSNYKLFTGVSLIVIAAQDNFSMHAYAIRAFQTITKVVTSNGTIEEAPNFNNIFDAFDFISPGMSLQVKKILVPITAEEFYNLDDMQ